MPLQIGTTDKFSPVIFISCSRTGFHEQVKMVTRDMDMDVWNSLPNYHSVITRKNVALGQKYKWTLPIDPRPHVRHASQNIKYHATWPLRAIRWQCRREREWQGVTRTPKEFNPRQWYSGNAFTWNSFEIPPEVIQCWIWCKIQAGATRRRGSLYILSSL